MSVAAKATDAGTVAMARTCLRFCAFVSRRHRRNPTLPTTRSRAAAATRPRRLRKNRPRPSRLLCMACCKAATAADRRRVAAAAPRIASPSIPSTAAAACGWKRVWTRRCCAFPTVSGARWKPPPPRGFAASRRRWWRCAIFRASSRPKFFRVSFARAERRPRPWLRPTAPTVLVCAHIIVRPPDGRPLFRVGAAASCRDAGGVFDRTPPKVSSCDSRLAARACAQRCAAVKSPANDRRPRRRRRRRRRRRCHCDNRRPPQSRLGPRDRAKKRRIARDSSAPRDLTQVAGCRRGGALRGRFVRRIRASIA